MEDINFSSLAPRQGTRPLMGTWGEIGTNQMNGGAFNWGSIWSGLKSFGTAVRNYGSKAWNSSTGQMLRDKLKDTGVQQKIVDGVTSGIHGALDLARQELDRQIASRLDPRPQVEVEEALPGLEKSPLPSAPSREDRPAEKRPRPEAEEELVVRSEEAPPSYDEIFGSDKSPPPSLSLKPTTFPMTRPVAPMARPVMGSASAAPAPPVVPPAPPAAPVVDTPATLDLPPPPVVKPAARPVAVATPAYSRGNNWQSTLSSIVGLGVKSVKRRRCY